jgi:KUP system potassium uptake protein
MTTWKRGRAAMASTIRATTLPLDMFMSDLRSEKPYRVKGTAVFMTQSPVGTPPALLHHFKHNKVLHEQVVLLSVRTEDVPEVPPESRVNLHELGAGFWQVTAHYGFMQTPNVPEIMVASAREGLKTIEADTSFYLGRETLLTTGRTGMSRWAKALFVLMSRNSRPATAFFGIPPGRVVELGTQIEL